MQFYWIEENTACPASYLLPSSEFPTSMLKNLVVVFKTFEITIFFIYQAMMFIAGLDVLHLCLTSWFNPVYI